MINGYLKGINNSFLKDKFIKFVNNKYFVFMVRVFFGLTFISVFVPLNPSMPSIGLDPSWKFALNQAVAQKLNFGTDIIFTFGPYASIYTGMFHPATDNIMMWGSLLISISYILIVIFLSRKNSTWLMVFSILILFSYIVDDTFYVKDVILFSYPVLISLLLLNSSIFPDNFIVSKSSILNKVMIILLVFPLGLLPLIKGTTLFLVVFCAFLSGLYVLIKKDKLFGVIWILTPILSTCFFWFVSGQSLMYFDSYFINIFHIIRGYSDAMSLQGLWMDVLIILIDGFFILLVFLFEKPCCKTNHILLFLTFSSFFYVGYKAGLVRHDFHALIAAETILFIGLLLLITLKNRLVIPVSFLLIFSWFSISLIYSINNFQSLFSRIPLVYSNAIQGVITRVSFPENLLKDYYLSIENIKNESYIPKFIGSCDIYSFNQSHLISSNNEWIPRPVFQSYVAYTPYLLDENKYHLSSENIPDNILFKLETIDGRYPTLDDGSSWPAILNQYNAINFIGPYIHFIKNNTDETGKNYTKTKEYVHIASHRLGEKIIIPKSDLLVYAEISLQPTILGNFSSLFYKRPEVWMKIFLETGEVQQYRLIPNMTEYPFILSPFVETTEDFYFLAKNEIQRLQKIDAIQIFSLDIMPGFHLKWLENLWEPEFILKLSIQEL